MEITKIVCETTYDLDTTKEEIKQDILNQLSRRGFGRETISLRVIKRKKPYLDFEEYVQNYEITIYFGKIDEDSYFNLWRVL